MYYVRGTVDYKPFECECGSKSSADALVGYINKGDRERRPGTTCYSYKAKGK